MKIKFIENESKLQNAESEQKLLKNKLLLRNIIYVSVILLLIVFILIYSFLQKRKSNKILEKKNIEINQKNEEISVQAEELKDRNLKLTELGEFKESMTGMIVHDLKNPLNSIIGLTEIFDENLYSEQYKRKVESVNQEAKKMLNLVSNILDVQKFEETGINPDITESNLYEISESAIKQVDLLIKQKNISVTDNTDKNIYVKADKQMLSRVYVNVLSNAIKYTPNNGKIKLYSEIDNESSVVIKIIDNGIGIPKDRLAQIFDKYNQLNPKKSGKTHSTGLGLTFCKMVIEAHEGKIYANSEQGSGSEFIFSIPNGFKLKNIENVKQTENEQKNENTSDFTNAEKEYLKQFFEILNKTEVHEISDLNNILDQIKPDSKNVIEWKNKIEEAIYFCNEVKYKELINY